MTTGARATVPGVIGTRAALSVDEELFLTATGFLHDQLEGHELLNIVEEFAWHPSVTERFAEDIGHAMSEDDRQAISAYVGGVYLVSHHRANLVYIDDMRGSMDGPTMDFVRRAAWSFLMAWNLRYGGFYAHRANGTLVAPDA